MSFGSFDDNNDDSPMSEINTTPLVDVMLVLLIIFMITAPLITNNINVNLPNTKTSASLEKPNVINLAIDDKNQIFLNEKKIDEKNLPQLLQNLAKEKSDNELRLQADRDVRYQRIAEIMAEVQKAGIAKLGFVSRVEK